MSDLLQELTVTSIISWQMQKLKTDY